MCSNQPVRSRLRLESTSRRPKTTDHQDLRSRNRGQPCAGSALGRALGLAPSCLSWNRGRRAAVSGASWLPGCSPVAGEVSAIVENQLRRLDPVLEREPVDPAHVVTEPLIEWFV
jgi:hypothetical protein